jgi:hypothetical protein
MRSLKATESQHQCTVVEWARAQESRWPVLKLLHSIPNGGGRGKPFITRGGKKLPPLLAVKLQKEGLLAGIPDLHIPAARGQWIGLYIEMKDDDGELSDAQRKIIPLLEAEGNKVKVCQGADSAIAALKAYIRLPKAIVTTIFSA